jgi:CheY-like chemotaxis protein
MHSILLVEDEKMLRDAYTILIEAQGVYRLDTAANGEEALGLCSKKNYDLILLDLMMPVLDGVGFLKKAKLKTKSPKTKLVIMSNLSSSEGLTEAIELGFARHEVKSNLSPADVLRVIHEELSA